MQAQRRPRRATWVGARFDNSHVPGVIQRIHAHAGGHQRLGLGPFQPLREDFLVQVSFIDFSFWPTFNVADCAISVGAVAIIVISLWKDFKKKK